MIKDFKAKENETVTESEIIINQYSSLKLMKRHSIIVNQENLYINMKNNLHACGL